MPVRTQKLRHAIQEDGVVVDYRNLSHHVGDLGKDEGNLIEINEFMLKLWK